MSLLYTAPPEVKAQMSKDNRDPDDFYPTRDYDIHATYRYFIQRGTFPTAPMRVLDIGAGEGPWGRILKQYRPHCHITGIDIRDVPQAEGYDDWIIGNFLTMKMNETFDFIIGNPPYNVAQPLIEKAWTVLEDGGSILMLLLLNFWSTQDRAVDFWRRIQPRHIGVYAKRPSFIANKKTDAREYACFDLLKGYTGETTTNHIYQPELVGKDEIPDYPRSFVGRTVIRPQQITMEVC